VPCPVRGPWRPVAARDTMRPVSRLAAALFLLTALLTRPVPSRASIEVAEADLAVVLRGPAEAVNVPEEARLIATVRNLGPGEASGVGLRLALPDGLRTAEVRPGPWSCAVDGRADCTLAVLPAGASAVVDLRVAVVSPGSLTVMASVHHTSTDPDPGSNNAAVVVEGTGRLCAEVGGPGPDVLRVRGRGEVGCGLRGDDVILGGDGRQALLGGPGHDSLGGGRGRDRLDGAEGRDACTSHGRGCEVGGLATASSLPLYRVARRTVGYGYHESLFGTAIAMSPLTAHRMMSSRGRGTGATTAVDVVVPSRARIRSPVTGTVASVTRYRLYCRTPDWKVVLAPRSHPRLRVLVLHMSRPAVREGDEVLGGTTLLGRAAVNDEASAQANRYFPDRYPHVHVEVERNRASPTPGCSIG
jgi:Domain of unknown function DUF11